MTEEKLTVVAEDNVQIPTGEHTGTIVGMDTSEYQPVQGTPYTYLSLIIGFDAKEGLPEGQTINWSAPLRINPVTKLGKVVTKFVDWKPEDKLVIEDIFLNKKVKFMTVDKPGKKGGVFATVVDESLEPIK